MKIISIRQKNKRTTNCIITLITDNTELIELNLSMDLIVNERLSKDMKIDDVLYEKLISEQRIIDAKQIAFNYVSYRKRSEKQIISNLKQKGFTDKEINSVLVFLNENKLLDDEMFAKSFVKDILLTKKIGRNKIFNMLYEKGVNKEIIVNVLNEYLHKDSLESAVIVAERKYNLMKNKPIEKTKQQLFNHLAAKGFTIDETKEAIDIILTKYAN